jgi:hypothetical protein
MKLLGIDFSGGPGPWRKRVKNPTVWIASVSSHGDRLRLDEVKPVQELAGSQSGFERLVERLKMRDFAVAAIDAPFSIPAAHIPSGSYSELLKQVDCLPNGADRSFPRGAEIIRLAQMMTEKACSKPLRNCERYWTEQGVNTRSTLWGGPRGGAPFAAACLALIVRVGRPCWPWDESSPGLLAEAFPAAQLRFWNLPHTGYSRLTGVAVRRRIINAISHRIELSNDKREVLGSYPDALDAVIAAFAAAAVAKGKVGVPPDKAGEEGWIAVHE